MTGLQRFPSPTTQPLVIVGGAYTALNSDIGKLVIMNTISDSDFTITTTTGLATGQRIDFANLSNVNVSFVAGSGVTIYSTPGLKFRARYSAASLICLFANAYLLIGDLSA